MRGWQLATTDDAGHFAIAGAVQGGAVIAQLGDRRSTPQAIADHVRLVLAPTRSVSGKVDLQGTPYTRLFVYCLDAADRSSARIVDVVVRSAVAALSRAPRSC